MKQAIAFVPIMEYNGKWQEVLDMEYLTTVEMSKKWNISSRRIITLCIEGRIDGVIKKGKMSLDEIADCVPLLSLDELKEIEAEVMQLA